MNGEGAGWVVVVGGVAESSDDVEAKEFVLGEVGREGDDPVVGHEGVFVRSGWSPPGCEQVCDEALAACLMDCFEGHGRVVDGEFGGRVEGAGGLIEPLSNGW